jgi:hypothetical protein
MAQQHRTIGQRIAGDAGFEIGTASLKPATETRAAPAGSRWEPLDGPRQLG